jgi:hypothetical protein
MRVWQAGQAMTRRRAASRSRRAAGTLREGGKAGRRVTGGMEERVAPDEGDEGEMAMQARPGSSLVVAEPELLLAVLMEPFDRPPLMRPSELVVERAAVERQGEVPRRFAILTRKGTFADEPTTRTGRVAVGAVNLDVAGLALAALLLRIEDGDRCPLGIRHASHQRLGTVDAAIAWLRSGQQQLWRSVDSLDDQETWADPAS